MKKTLKLLTLISVLCLTSSQGVKLIDRPCWSAWDGYYDCKTGTPLKANKRTDNKGPNPFYEEIPASKQYWI